MSIKFDKGHLYHMRELFGTDGVRGKANIYPMTTEMAMQIGRAVAYIFKNKGKKHKILVGRDTRISGPMLESALISGICSMGAVGSAGRCYLGQHRRPAGDS
jgi:phosphomannomutase